MRARRLGRLTAALIAVAAVGCGTACADGGAAAPVAGPGAVAPASPDPQAQAAEKAALAAYAGYLAASRKAESAANPRHPELRKYLADPLLTRVRLAIRDAKEHGAMRTGTLISDPTVTEVSLDAVPATVSIQDCLDSTGYRLVYAKDRSAVPGTRGGRHLATATATRYPGGRWLISAGAVHQDQPC